MQFHGNANLFLKKQKAHKLWKVCHTHDKLKPSKDSAAGLKTNIYSSPGQSYNTVIHITQRLVVWYFTLKCWLTRQSLLSSPRTSSATPCSTYTSTKRSSRPVPERMYKDLICLYITHRLEDSKSKIQVTFKSYCLGTQELKYSESSIV